MKRLITFLVMLAFSTSIFAGSISRGGGSFGGSRSFSSPARSVGVSRPSVMPKYSAPAPRTNTVTPPPAPVAAAAGAPVASSGSPFLSSLGGSFLGSMLGSSIGSSHHGGGGGTTVVSGGGGVAGAPVVVSSSGTGFWAGLLSFLACLLFVIAIVAGLMWLHGAWSRRKAYSERQRVNTISFAPVERFIAIQTAFAARDENTLRNLLGNDLRSQLLADLPEKESPMTLRSINYSVLEAEDTFISIAYMAHDTADDSELDEVWHFQRIGGEWKLQGIEQP